MRLAERAATITDVRCCGSIVVEALEHCYIDHQHYTDIRLPVPGMANYHNGSGSKMPAYFGSHIHTQLRTTAQ